MDNAEVRAYRVMVKGRGGADLCIGTVHRATSYASGERAEGWKYNPQTQSRPSRRLWPTASAALKGRVNAYTLVPVAPITTPRTVTVGTVEPMDMIVTETDGELVRMDGPFVPESSADGAVK